MFHLPPRLQTAIATALLSFTTAASYGTVTINEIRTDQPGSDTNEYIELFSDQPSESLGGMTLLVLGDSSDGSGVVESVIALDGLTAAPFALLAPETFAIVGADTPDGTLPANFFENSDNLTVLLVTNFTGSLNDDLDTDDDGELDSTPWDSVVDAVGIIEEVNPPGFTEYEYATALGFPTVGPGDGSDFFGNTTTPGHVYRTVDGGGVWEIGLFDVFDFEAVDSPGGTNVVSQEITLTLGSPSISENGGTTTFTVQIDEAAVGDKSIVISFGNVDRSEVAIPAVVVPDGQTSVTVTASGIDDAWRDFDQQVEIRAKAFGFIPGVINLTVTDDETGLPSGLRINEILANPTADVNLDGSTSATDDEFIEIINDSATEIDISGYEIYDGSELRHTFADVTILDAGCGIVVFGGGSFTEGPSLDFGGATILKANGDSKSLALNNNGDSVSLRDPAGVEVGGFTYAVANSGDGSLTMSPDLNETNLFESHFVAGGTAYSPGRLVNGDPICDFDTLMLSVSPDMITEDAGAMASVLTITRSGDFSEALTVSLTFDDSEISLPATADFAVGVGTIMVGIDAVDDDGADGDQLVTIAASASGFFPGTATITVSDDGDVNTSTLVINEVDYDIVGADGGLEFVEIYDGGGGNTSLDGHVLALYNGSNGDGYNFIDLDGMSTDASGLLVVETPGLQNGGPDGVALFSISDASLFNSTDIDSIPNSAIRVDSIVYEIGDSTTLDALGYTGPDLSDSNTDDVSLSRMPDGGAWGLGAPTRGTSNGSASGSAYDLWAAGFAGIGGKLDDDDSDGLDNIAEYALGLDPLVSDRGSNPSFATDGGDLQLSVTKGSEAGSDPNLTYTIEVSTDLANWTTDDLEVVEDSGSLTATYTGSAERVYMRVVFDLL